MFDKITGALFKIFLEGMMRAIRPELVGLLFVYFKLGPTSSGRIALIMPSKKILNRAPVILSNIQLTKCGHTI
jgi:hypothetical protein